MFRTGGRPRITGAYLQISDPATAQKFRLLASTRVRAPPDAIPAPPFPRDLEWVNVAPLRMDKQRGRPVLVEFWDFCRVNSLRTLPYLMAWHERYADDGLRVIGIHTGGFLPAREPEAVRAAVARLGIEYPVVIDERLELWDFYGNEGWPARYLWDRDGALYSMHYGEGAYAETEREIQALLGVERELVPPLRPEDEEGVLLPAQTADQPGAYSGPVRGGRRMGGARGRGIGAGRRSRDRGRRARRISVDRARPPHARRAGARGRPRRHLPRHLLHARLGLSSSCPRSPSRRTSSGGPLSPTRIAVPGQ